MDRNKIENVASEIVDSCYQVHKALGPGLLESAYQKCLAFELRDRGLEIEVEKPVPIEYKKVKLDCGYRLDMMVENFNVKLIKQGIKRFVNNY